MLQAGQSNRVTFKVNVMGTSAEPAVRLILGTSPELSFQARAEGDAWVADVAIPETTEAGSYDLRVEVVLNGRLFSPLRKKVEIQAPLAAEIETAQVDQPQELPPEPELPEPIVEPVAEPTVPEPVAVEPVLPVEEPKKPAVDPAVRDSLMKAIALDPEATAPKEPSNVKKKNAPPKIQVVGKMPKIVPKAAPKLEDLLPSAPQPSKLEELAKRTPKRRYAVSTPLPKPGSVEAKPITVKISEINAASASIETKIVEAAPVVEVQTTTHKSGVPVRLITEHIFYE